MREAASGPREISGSKKEAIMDGMVAVEEAKIGERIGGVEGTYLDGLPSWEEVRGWESQKEEGQAWC